MRILSDPHNVELFIIKAASIIPLASFTSSAIAVVCPLDIEDVPSFTRCLSDTEDVPETEVASFTFPKKIDVPTSGLDPHCCINYNLQLLNACFQNHHQCDEAFLSQQAQYHISLLQTILLYPPLETKISITLIQFIHSNQQAYLPNFLYYA